MRFFAPAIGGDSELIEEKMIIEFKLPELGDNITSADITRVFVKAGDKIEKDQPVVEIETDKASVEVPSEISGVVKEVLVKAGDKTKSGNVLIKIESVAAVAVQEKIENEKLVDTIITKPEPVKVVETVSANTSTEPMIIEFKLPELGDNILSADLTKILVSANDKIEVDQPLFEIETDKATVEVPSDVNGIVKKISVKAGEKVKPSQTILLIETTSPVMKNGNEKSIAAAVVPVKVEEIITTKLPEKNVIEDNTHAARQFKKEITSQIAPAAPSVRRFAREIGIDIHQVRGSGPGNRISIEDVKAYSKNINEQLKTWMPGQQSGAPASFVGIARETLPDFSKWGEVERQPMSNVRRKTAEHLSYAWATIPHVTQFDKADITELEKLRKLFGKKVEDAGGKLTVTGVLLKVIASAMKVFPQFNSSVDMEKNEVIFKKFVNVGIAVDTDRGLLVPVIRDIDKKNITQLSIELAEISKKARDKKLSLEDMQGGCFTISNLGGIGGTYFTPIVNSPEVAILGVSRSAFEPVYIEGEFKPRLMMPLSLSYDHRIIDGADGIRFLRWVINALENPFLLSLEG
ncbi:MAG: 2-oxo acid dehydrogenase subunit E2 [bacterium]